MGCGASSGAKYKPGIEAGTGAIGLAGASASTFKKLLGKTPLLADVPSNTLTHFVSGAIGEPWKVKDGTSIVDQGETPEPGTDFGLEVDGMWLLVEGCVEAVRTYAPMKGSKLPALELCCWEYRVGKDTHVGDWFGEGVLLGETERGVTYQAKGLAKVLHIRRSAWEELRNAKREKVTSQAIKKSTIALSFLRLLACDSSS